MKDRIFWNMRIRNPFKQFTIRTLAVAVCCLGCACADIGATPASPADEACSPPVISSPSHATRFRMTAKEGRNVLSIDMGESGVAENHWLLVGRDQPLPDNNRMPVLRIPLKRVALLSTTFLAHFSALQATDTICAVDNAAYAFDAGVRERIQNGSIPEIGEMDTLDLETVIHLRPDAIFVSAGMGGAPGRRERLAKLGIPVIEIPDFLEPHPLGRAEWIKLFGLLLDRSDVASKHFDAVSSRYKSIRAAAAAIPPAKRPTVLLHSPFQGLWHLPSGDSYAARLLNDAGGKYLFPELKAHSARPFDFEWVIAHARHADIWMQVDASSLKAFGALDPRFTQFDAYQSQQVYSHFKRTDASGGNDFYESGVIHPERILEDLFSIFSNWPDTVPEDSLHYFMRLH